ncbi:hypothetical protein TeGR_g1671 [Tetraparma gracilis]|uniref:ASCH domain-containing protein n=1 Tax=Tetraparma gracilis TaxID=2962635 RepID=A0ABQ6N1P0_9STRA|nr:hypothetical protein TeGR_g1671 [Tetraparma gracilis]
MASAATVAAAAAPTALDFSPQFVAPIKAGNKVKTARILDASVKGGEPQLSGIVAALDAGPIKTIATADSECFARIIVTSCMRTTVGELTDVHARDEQFVDKEEFKSKLKEFYDPLLDHCEVFIFAFRVDSVEEE